MTSDERLLSERFPRSSRYHPDWVIKNGMGSNPLWIAEWLSQAMDLREGMRVLDLGCGRASSSIFLRREFGVQVWATDLWFSASENLQRIRDAGVEDGVFPIHADARRLPFAAGFFDAVISLDAFFYFGTDDLYLGEHFARLVRPGGEIGIVVPGLVGEFDAEPPGHLAPAWARDPEVWSFHSPEWWRRHWVRSGVVDVELADLVPRGWQHWLNWDEASLELGYVAEQFVDGLPAWIETMRSDAGRNLGFTRVVARRKPETRTAA